MAKRQPKLFPLTYSVKEWRKQQAAKESTIQIAVVHHLELFARDGVYWWHTPNGEERSEATARKLKAMGVRPGISDLLIIYRGKLHALELKRETGSRTTAEQTLFHVEVLSTGGACAVAKGFGEALKVLESWDMLRHHARVPKEILAASPEQ